MGPESEVDPSSEAERAFVEHVLRSQGPLDLEQLRRAHPEHAGELETLHGRWTSALRGASLADRLRQRHGQGVDPQVSLEGAERELPDDTPAGARTRAAAGPSSSIYAKLAAHGDTAGRYVSRGEIARGGMGAILRVWDEDLRRVLAMKVALTRGEDQPGDSEAVESDRRLLNRFLEEAQITGQLDHPGIVPVHELGLDAVGRVYFTMRLVKGRDLKQVFELVRRGAEGWSRTRALGVLQRVCEAMAFAHEKGVIHRDLKPANIMVGRFGETYVMDWGLARVLGREDSHDVRLKAPDASLSIVRTDRADDRTDERTPDSPLMTMDGDIVGTPCYMSPEQARGRLADIGPRSDVYSLGSMLYHLLSGHMPYVREGQQVSPQTVLGLLMNGPPEAVRELDAAVPEELVAICDKAMARDPARRYPGMLELSEDLRAYLEGRVVRAFETGSVAEFKKWIRRNKAAAVASAAAVVLALAGLATVILVQAGANRELTAANAQIEEARDQALVAKSTLEETNADLEAARDESLANAREARLSGYAANVAAASASLRLGNAADALQRLDGCDEDLRGWEWRHLRLAADASLRTVPFESPVQSVAVDPLGLRVAVGTADGRGQEPKIHLLRVEDGSLEREIEIERGALYVLEFTPDGARVAAPTRDRRIHLWDVETGREVSSFGRHSSLVTGLDFSPDGTRAVTGSSDKRVRVWNVRTGEREQEFKGHRSHVTCVAFGPSGRLVASGSQDRTVRLWDVETGEQIRELTGFEYPVAFVDFSPDGSVVTAGCASSLSILSEELSRGANTVRTWSADDGRLLGVLGGARGRLSSGGFDPGGNWILASSSDATVRLWDLLTGRDQVLLGHQRHVADAAFGPDGSWLVSVGGGNPVTGSGDSELKFWNPQIQLGFPLRGHSGLVTSATFALDGGLLVSTSIDRTLRSWDTRTGLVRSVFRGHAGAVAEVAASPDGRTVASCGIDGTVRLWDAQTGNQLLSLGVEQAETLTGAAGASLRLDFHPGGRFVAVGATVPGDELLITVWDLVEQEVATRLHTGPGHVAALRWSRDGERLAASTQVNPREGSETRLRLWDRRSGEVVVERVVTEGIRDMAFSPDGRTLAAALYKTVHLLDPDDLSTRLLLSGHESPVGSLSFSPDGSRLVSGGSDSVRVWDARSGSALLILEAPGTDVNDVAFSPDGAQVAICYSDWSAFLWSTLPSEVRDTARRAEFAARHSTLSMLDGLFERFFTTEAVVERLRNDPSLEAPRLRTAAGLARLATSDPHAVRREAWRVLRLPGQPEEDVHVALWSTLAADHAEPDDVGTLGLLGAAYYRVGRHAEALEALERSNTLRMTRAQVEVLAFLAMTQHRLGRQEEARRSFDDLRLLMQVPINLTQRDNQALYRETEAVLARPPG